MQFWLPQGPIGVLVSPANKPFSGGSSALADPRMKLTALVSSPTAHVHPEAAGAGAKSATQWLRVGVPRKELGATLGPQCC